MTPHTETKTRVFIKLTGLVLFALILANLANLAFSSQSHAAKPEIYTGFGSSLAVGGYDTVAYFTEGAPVKGSKSFSTEYKGATWRFSSQENLNAFEADPTAYAPQYGGYCAWATAQGYLAKGNPKFWTIYEGALYLNYSKSVQKDWLEDVPGFIETANNNWPGILE